MVFRHLAAVLLCCGLLLHPRAGHAAESYDNCNNFITTLPTTISTQGVWCLKNNLSTNIASGAAITIAANNVTIDCNDFKIGGLAAGNASVAKGIAANSRQNVTVRNCNIRGFLGGIYIVGDDTSGGHLIEDNRLDNNLQLGILVLGSDNAVRRNLVFATGGSPNSNNSIGIEAYGDVIDNTVSGVFATTTDTYPYGIYVLSNNSEIRGNRVRGLMVAGSGDGRGIAVSGIATTVADNRVANSTPIDGTAFFAPNSYCLGNTAAGYANAAYYCGSSLGNLPATP